MVEATVNDLGVHAWVVRFESPIVGWDYVLVVKPSGFVITLWLNHEDDCHHTLDISKYVAPELQVEQTEG